MLTVAAANPQAPAPEALRPALALTVNLGWAVYGATAANWWTSEGADLGAVALMAQANLAAAVVFRQPYILNALAWLMTRSPTSWPLRVRWALGKYYHFGGLHVGAALDGTLWYLIFCRVDDPRRCRRGVTRPHDPRDHRRHAEVSHHHAVVSDTGSSFVITDLRSANGVYVHGRRIRGSVALADRDRIRMGDHEFVFEIEPRDC